MDYYIQGGGAAKADKIKAAFDKLGYDVKGWAFTSGMYYTLNGRIVNTHFGSNEYELVLNNPGYKELELSVEPMFWAGDWIVRGRGFVYEPSLITEIRDYYVCELLTGERVTYTLNDVHKNFHRWSITDAKDGDVICTPNNNLFIYKCKGAGLKIYDYCGLYHGKFEPDSGSPNGVGSDCDGYVPATKEQRDLLFAKLREAGCEWDADKKELRKIQPHYDIANFKPFDKVLVRDRNNEPWRIAFYGYYNEEANYSHFVGTCWSKQCIPYNDDTKHLLGTTDMPSEEFINW